MRGANSAYSKVTYETCTRLAKAGHKVAHIPMGFANKMGKAVYEDVVVYNSGQNAFGEDVAASDYADFNADALITIKENWNFQIIPNMALNWIPMVICDHSPISESMTRNLEAAFKVISVSRHAQFELMQHKIESTYIPHGVNTSVFKPLDKAKCRKLWHLDPDEFVVLIVAMNRARKMIVRQLQGYKRFLEMNPGVKSHLMLWSNVYPNTYPEADALGVADVGVSLLPEIMRLGLGDAVRWVDSKTIDAGIPDYAGDNYENGWDMVKLYNSADVLLAATGGEGACLPLLEAQSCLPPDSLIYCNGGMQTIESIKVGDSVLGHDGIWHKVLKTLNRQFNGDLIEIETSRFRFPVRLTPEHPVLLENGQWIEAKKVKMGDRVCFPISREEYSTLYEPKIRITDYVSDALLKDGKVFFQGGCHGNKKSTLWSHPNTYHVPNEISLTSDFLRLCGYFIAEGSAKSSNQARFAFNINEKEYIEDVQNIVKTIFDIDVTIEEREDQNTTIISINSKLISELFFKLFGRGAHNKHIPTAFLLLPVNLQAQLIKGLWRGDGDKQIDVHGYVTYGYTTVSRVLAGQISLILLRMGVVPQTAKYTSWGGKYGSRVCYRHAVKGDQTEKLNYIFDSYTEQKERNYVRDTGLRAGFLSLRVQKITKISYNGTVHNLEVEGSNSYTTESFIVHNCGVPVVTTNYAGAPEHVGSGYTVPWNDYVVLNTPGTRFALASVEGIAEALTKVLNGNREKMAERARNFALRYDWDRIIDANWKPFLGQCAEELFPLITKEGVKSWV